MQGYQSPRFGMRHPCLAGRTEALPFEAKPQFSPRFLSGAAQPVAHTKPQLTHVGNSTMSMSSTSSIDSLVESAVPSVQVTSGLAADATWGRPASARHRMAPMLIETRPLSAREPSTRHHHEIHAAAHPPQPPATEGKQHELVAAWERAAVEPGRDAATPPPAWTGDDDDDDENAISLAPSAGAGMAGEGRSTTSMAQVLDVLRRSPMLVGEPVETLQLLVEFGELRPIRRYLSTSAYTHGDLAVVITGAFVTVDAEPTKDEPAAHDIRAAAAAAAAAAENSGEPSRSSSDANADANERLVVGGEARLGPGALLCEEALMPLRGGEHVSAGRFHTLLPSTLLLVPHHVMAKLRADGRLRQAAERARARVLARRLRSLESPLFRRMPTPTLAAITPLLEMRIALRGDSATPADCPDAFVIVLLGAVSATDSVGKTLSTHTPDAAACWCNEAALLGRSRPAAPPVATESPTVVLLCPPQNFSALKATMPHLVAAAGSPALLALRDAMASARLTGEDALRKVPELLRAESRGRTATSALANVDRWERLVRRLLPYSRVVEKTMSLNTRDYIARRPINRAEMGQNVRVRVVNAPLLATQPPPRAERGSYAQSQAKAWQKTHLTLKSMNSFRRNSLALVPHP